MLYRVVLLLITGAAFALAACGDEEDPGPSKAEFIERADAICREGEERAEQLARTGLENPREPTGSEVLAILEQLVPIQRDIIEGVRELERPSGDEDEIDRFLTQAAQATDEIAEIRNPQQALAAVEATGTRADPFYEANRAARQYGLKVCGD